MAKVRLCFLKPLIRVSEHALSHLIYLPYGKAVYEMEMHVDVCRSSVGVGSDGASDVHCQVLWAKLHVFTELSEYLAKLCLHFWAHVPCSIEVLLPYVLAKPFLRQI